MSTVSYMDCINIAKVATHLTNFFLPTIWYSNLVCHVQLISRPRLVFDEYTASSVHSTNPREAAFQLFPDHFHSAAASLLVITNAIATHIGALLAITNAIEGNLMYLHQSTTGHRQAPAGSQDIPGSRDSQKSNPEIFRDFQKPQTTVFLGFQPLQPLQKGQKSLF